jgi:hypothetical protein
VKLSVQATLYKQKYLFFKNGEQEEKTGPIWGLATVGEGRIQGKGVGGQIWWKNYVLMYENGKIRSVETIPGMGETGIKENDGGVNSTMIYCKNFVKCHNAHQ